MDGKGMLPSGNPSLDPWKTLRSRGGGGGSVHSSCLNKFTTNSRFNRTGLKPHHTPHPKNTVDGSEIQKFKTTTVSMYKSCLYIINWIESIYSSTWLAGFLPSTILHDFGFQTGPTCKGDIF